MINNNIESSPENNLSVVSDRKKAYHTPQLIALGEDLVQGGTAIKSDGCGAHTGS